MAYFGFAATSWAWAAPVKSSSERLVLLALAKYADGKGGAFPSADTLSYETKLNRKTVFSAITSLCEAGLIVRTVRPGQGRRNNYELRFDRTENGITEIGTYQKRDVPKTELSMSQKRYVQSTENGTSNVPKTVREQRREQRKEQRREQRSNAPAKNSPVESPCLNTNPNPTSLFAEDEPPLPFEDVPPLDDPEGLFDLEADLPEADPDLPVIATEAQPGPESEEGKPKLKRKSPAKKAADWPVEDDGVDAETREAYLALRKSKRQPPFSPKAYELFKKQATKHGVSVQVALEKCIERGWIFPYDGAFEKEKNYGKTQQSQQKSAFLRPQSEIDYTYGLDRWNRA